MSACRRKYAGLGPGGAHPSFLCTPKPRDCFPTNAPSAGPFLFADPRLFRRPQACSLPRPSPPPRARDPSPQRQSRTPHTTLPVSTFSEASFVLGRAHDPRVNAGRCVNRYWAIPLASRTPSWHLGRLA